VKAVSTFLGHKNAAETLNTYSHLWPNDEDRITAAIDAGFFARCSTDSETQPTRSVARGRS